VNQSSAADRIAATQPTATRARLLQVVGWTLVIGVAGLAVWAFIEAVQAEPAIVGSVATAALAVGGVVWQQRRTERERLAEVRRERMAPMYEDLLGFVLRGGQSSEQGEPPEDLAAFMKDLKGRQLLLGASSEMIRAFNAWQAETQEAEANGSPLGAIQAYEGLLRAIRKDLGHDDSDLAKWDLLRVFINDLDDHLPDDRPLKAVA
jgi:hypothetical protein